MPAHNSRRVTPFGHPRIKALSAAPRGLSRPHTSFIGTACQGIHHTPMATNPPTPQKGGPTGPCHLHWNTLRQLIRSSKTPPTPTRAWTAYQNTREHNPRTHPTGGHGTVRQNQQYEHTRHTPQGTPFMLASTLQFSNHHTTPPQAPTPQGARPGRRERNTTPDKGPGGPGTQQHAPHHCPPTPQGRRRLDLFPASKGRHPARKPGKEASPHRRTTVRPQNSVERR